jgi:glycosyltransferase involved in cell wall biosynthesis
MKVSLVTAVRNEAASANRLIRSIRQQSRTPDEWLVVDGSSTDGTAEVFQRASGCRLIREAGNIAHARNLAVHEAVGEVIAVIDGGCVAEPGWLERLVEPLERGLADVAAGATVPEIVEPFDAAQWVLLDQFQSAALGLRKPALSSRSVAFLRTAWERCGYPEWLDHSEDTWLFEQWRRLGMRIVHVPEAAVQWTLRATIGRWFEQHFKYMRGQGRAGMFRRRQLARVVLYGLVGALLMTGFRTPLLAFAGGAVWALYLGVSLVRFPAAVRGRSLLFKLRALAWLPVMLLTMDVAKAAGYLRGLLDRAASRT